MCTSATVQDDFFEDFIRRLEPKIDLLIEKACTELRRQQRELEREKANALGKVEKELQPLTVAENGESQKDAVDEATPVSSFTLAPDLVQQVEAIPTRPLLGIPRHSLNVNSTMIASLRKPLSIFTSRTKSPTQKRISSEAIVATEVNKLTVVARKLSMQHRSSNSRPHKLIRWQISQFKYRRKSRQQLLKSRKGWNQFRRRVHIPSHHQNRYFGKRKVESHSLNKKVGEGLCIVMKKIDFEDSRTNPFEEGEYDVILVSITKPRTRRGRIDWPEVLSWLKDEGIGLEYRALCDECSGGEDP